MKHIRLTGFLVVAASAAWAQPSPSASGPDGRPPRKPPPEAISACSGKTEGAEVSFTLRDGVTRKGVCKLIDGILAVAPPDGPPPGAGGRPPAK